MIWRFFFCLDIPDNKFTFEERINKLTELNLFQACKDCGGTYIIYPDVFTPVSAFEMPNGEEDNKLYMEIESM